MQVVLKNVDLKPYTTLKTAAVVEEFVEVKTEAEFVEAVKSATAQKKPFMVVGGGSNTVFAKSSVPGLIIRNLYFDFQVMEETDKEALIRVSSGMPVSMLIQKTTERGLEGFEYHLGLPGTVGGAIHMNSKWTRPLNYFGDHLESALLIDKEGNEKNVTKEYFKFAYDFSELQKTKEVLLYAFFRLKKTNSDELKARAKEALEYRKNTQPFGVASSGCMFQNVDGKSAGELIDKAGLKGTRVGNFVVSDKHANFIINEGNGNIEDLKKLLVLIKAKVKEVHGVDLVEEVRIIE